MADDNTPIDISDQSTYSHGQLGAVNGFIFHHTAGRDTPQGTVDTLNQRGLGVQYVMDRDGTIYQTLPTGARGAHIENSPNTGLSNDNTMGMEIIAKDDSDVTAAQVASARQFAAGFAQQHPGVQFYGHGEVNPGHKEATEGLTVTNAVRGDLGGAPRGGGGGGGQSDGNTNEFETPVGPRAATTATGAGTPTPVPGYGPLPAVAAAIAKASAATGVPADYLGVTSMIESSGGRNLGSPSADAQGPFQFTTGTAAAYGLVNRQDPEQSALAAANLALANKAALEKALGRPATWDEVYLAHQQGNAGAAKLLNNPDMAAGQLVGESAISGNGGAEYVNQPASAFINLWKTKYNSTLARMSGAPGAPIAGGVDNSAKWTNPSPAQTMSDIVFGQAGPGAGATPPVTTPAPGPVSASDLGDVFTSAMRSQELDANGNASAVALYEAVTKRNTAIKDETGVQLPNPYDLSYADLRPTGQRGQLPTVTRDNLGFAPSSVDALQARLEDYQRQLNVLTDLYPAKAAIIGANRSLQDDAAAQANQAVAAAAAAYGKTGGGVGPFVASLAGGLVGGFRDPMNVAAMAVGGPELKAATTFGKIAGAGLRDAAINAGAQLIQEPSVQAWRQERGQESGVLPAAEDVGMAALFGLILGAGGKVLHMGFEALKPSTVAGMARGDLRAAAEVASALPAGTGDSLKASVVSEALDRETKPPPVPGSPTGDAPVAGELPTRIAAVSPAENAQVFRESIRVAEDPINEPKPAPPSAALVPPPAEPHLVDTPASRTATTPLPLPEPGHPASFEYGGRPVEFANFKPGELTTDAQTFQYKGGGDARGVTDRLGAVAQWDPLAGGNLVVFERNDGTYVVADGHQRAGLAQRLDDTSPTPIELQGYVFREADGWTPQDVRAIAAKKNIQEGSGDALDTARILRERPDLWDATLPMSDVKIKQAQGLARLSPEAWQMAINGVVPPNYAAQVGRMVDNTELHTAVMGDLAKFKPGNEQAARLVIGDAVEAGFARYTQDSLFGAEQLTRSLSAERAQVFTQTMQLLKTDKRVFSVLDREQGRIEAEGNTLAPDANRARATQASQLEQALETLASRSGPVSAALNRWAEQVSIGLKVARASRGFAEELTALIEKEGLRLGEQPKAEVPTAKFPAETPKQAEAQSRMLAETLAAPGEKPAEKVAAGEPAPEGAPEAAPAEKPAPAGEAALTEPTKAGEQRLIPGVEPVTERQRLEAEAAKPLAGGEKAPPAGGLFDETARAQRDIFDTVPMADRGDGADMRPVPRDEALAEVPREAEMADVLRSCQP